MKHLFEEFLIKSFSQYSIFWFFISTVIGGFIGASFKIFFENLIPTSINSFRQTNEDFKSYLHSLLLSARYTDNRLSFLIRDRNGKFHYNNENSKISFYYSICQYFCWMKILQENALNKFLRQPKRYRKFIILFFDVHKSFCSNFHFKELVSLNELYERGAVIPAYEINSIVDSMFSNINDNKTIIKSPIISQSEFISKYKNDQEFRMYFSSFDSWLNSIEPSPDNLAWNRLLLFSYHIKLLIKYIDEKSYTTIKVERLNIKHELNEKVLKNMNADKEAYRKNKIKTCIDLI